MLEVFKEYLHVKWQLQIGYDPSGGIPVDPSSANAVPRPPVMRGGMRGRGRGGPMTGRFPQVSNNRGDGKTLQVGWVELLNGRLILCSRKAALSSYVTKASQ